MVLCEKCNAEAVNVSYPIVCSVCGKDDTVPFKPDPDRSVRCRNCFLSGKNQ